MITKSRETYFDFFRGIAIIFVIGIHTFTNTNGLAGLYLKQLLNCGVPMFVAISGYFIGQKKISSWHDYKGFLSRHIARVYIPMLIWSIPFVYQGFIQHIFPRSYILVLWFIGGLDIMYFVTLIIQLYFLTPLINRIIQKKEIIILSALISLISIGFIEYLQIVKNVSTLMVTTIGLFPTWLVFYVMGVKSSKSDALYLKWGICLVGISVSLVLCMFEDYMTRLHFGNVIGYKISTHILSFFVIALLFHPYTKEIYNKIENSRITHSMCWVGQVSFLIYLTHCLVLMAIHPYFFINFWVIDWALLTLLTILGVFVIHKIIPKHLQRYIGL